MIKYVDIAKKTDEIIKYFTAIFLRIQYPILISYIRLILALSINVVFMVDFENKTNNLFSFIFVLYAILSAATIIIIYYVRTLQSPYQYIIHFVDMSITLAVMFLHQDVTSFAFFQFTLINATLRWNLRGAVGTAGCLVFLLWVLYWLGISPNLNSIPAETNELTDAVFRSGFLLVGGVMLAYLGAYRERSHRRFAKLASWPAVHAASSVIELLDILLRYSADIIQAPRILVIWDDKEEPDRCIALWTQEGVQYTQEQPGLFGNMVAPSYETRAFIYPPATLSVPPHVKNNQSNSIIDTDLLRTFGINTALSAPFFTARCQGRVFVLDTPVSEDDIFLISVIASRIGTGLEARIMRRQLEFAAVMSERTKLSRDLHDGVLQGLAAANMQLKVLAIALPPNLQEQLRTIRNTLTDEAQRIRSFVEANRATAPSPQGIAQVVLEAEKRVSRLRDLWACEIALSVDPPDLATSITTMRNVGHMIAEGVSNAVRHGHASRITIGVFKREDRLVLDISDNGQGFKDLTGSYTANELKNMSTGPLSLRSRAEECGGTLYLTCSPEGTRLTVDLPI